MNKLDELLTMMKHEHALITAKKNHAPFLFLQYFNLNEIILLPIPAKKAKRYAFTGI